ncbi:MAG: PA2779 family protein [Betaproteobacteria bacterium]|nr:PA2779 family protein [Betaproteobacteria bacterium]
MKNNNFIANTLMALLCMGMLAATTLAHGEMIGTQQAVQASDSQDKSTIDRFITREDVQKKLQDMGLSAVVTAQRIALLNDDEARALAEKINAMPAGGNFSSLSTNDIIILMLGAILLVLIL